MYTKPNIRPELTTAQAGLIIHAIDQLVVRENAGGLSAEEVENLARVAHNLAIRINMGVTE